MSITGRTLAARGLEYWMDGVWEALSEGREGAPLRDLNRWLEHLERVLPWRDAEHILHPLPAQ